MRTLTFVSSILLVSGAVAGAQQTVTIVTPKVADIVTNVTTATTAHTLMSADMAMNAGQHLLTTINADLALAGGQHLLNNLNADLAMAGGQHLLSGLTTSIANNAMIAGFDAGDRAGFFDYEPRGYANPASYNVPAPVLPAPRSARPVDAADSLYRLGRSALTDGDYKKAATIFATVSERYPDSEFAPDALYYRAYALFKSGSPSELRAAVLALDRQTTRYPKANTLNDAKQLRASIISEQARRGDSDAASEIARGATTLRNENRCPTDDDDMRLTALNGIVQMDPDQVIPVLQKLLARTDECSVRLRKRAVYMVAQTKEEERADILLRVASTDPNAEVRRESIQWLSSVKTERAARALDSILFSTGDADMRDRALNALSQHGSPSARASLRRFAEQTNVPTDLRARAIYSIANGRRSGDEADYLRGLFNKTASPELREAVIRSFANLKTPDRSTWLLGIARDKNQEIAVRKQALYQAGQGSELKDLLSLYDDFSGDVEMQDQMLYVYKERRETEATDKLIQIAKNEKNTELRKKAILWLGQRKDPRVKQILLDILNP
ncbi:MAG: HEAT repeat domain-containing protein [Gemmatimonadota bacterium]